MVRGVISLVIGSVMVVGGMTGKLTLRGTGSGGALAALGAVIVVIGIIRILASRPRT